MVGRLMAVVLWLFAGHLVLGGVYWGLLSVPESNVLTLAVSALLGLLLAIGAGIVDTTGLLWVRADWTSGLGGAIRRSVRVLPAFFVAVAVWVGVCWICLALDRYHDLHGTELDAWLIAKFDWTNTAWLHRTFRYLLDFIELAIGTSLAVTFLAVAAGESPGDVVRLRWIPRALAPLQLVIIAAAVYGLIWLPWQAVYWRPASLPPNTVEIVFAIVKLALIGLLMHVGWAIVLWIPRRRRV